MTAAQAELIRLHMNHPSHVVVMCDKDETGTTKQPVTDV